MDDNKNVKLDGRSKRPANNQDNREEGAPWTKTGKVDLPPPSPGDYGGIAFDFFNNIHFFESTSRLDFFANEEETKKQLTMTLQAFFETAWQREQHDAADLTVFFMTVMPLCISAKVLKVYKTWKRVTGVDSKENLMANLPRMASVGFQIQNSKLSHTYDLECFSERMDRVFKCHGNEDYVAPYFCFVQSSGMGKTKLLHAYIKMSLQERGVASFLILPLDVHINVPEEEKEIFDPIDLIDFGPQPPADESTQARKEADLIFSRLDDRLVSLVARARNCPSLKAFRKVALLFDESQGLLKAEYGYEAFRFRCVRLWLREKGTRKNFRGREKLSVVAVFTGTNLKLTNFLFHGDEELTNFLHPSGGLINHSTDRFYFKKGTQIHLPYYQTTTMGSCLYLLDALRTTPLSQEAFVLIDTEYKRSVYYGRPLFAHMANEGKLETEIPTVLLRMLRMLHDLEWKSGNPETLINFLSTCINLFATRIQLGQTSAEVASDLVANSFANLCGYNALSKAVLIAYYPDPVCARLAMCMMDEDYRKEVTVLSNPETVCGKSKKWWTFTLIQIFSSGIMSPEKGDFGEVLVALYMLFCGDLLRKRINKENEEKCNGIQDYSQFSVSLDAWVQLMMSGGHFAGASDGNCHVSVGFIQVCRNHMRSYSHSWTHLKDQCFLKHIYEAGIAFYTCNNCPVIDMVVPLRIKSQTSGNIDGFVYAPMLVSIKCHAYFSKKDAETVCNDMVAKAQKDKLENALCLLIIFGSEPIALQKSLSVSEPILIDDFLDSTIMDSTKVSELVKDGIVAKTLRIPQGDAFGMNEVLDAMTSKTQIEAELLSSHPFLMAHGPDKEEDANLKAGMALRRNSSNESKKVFDALRKAMTVPRNG